MHSQTFQVFIDIDSTPILVGNLWSHFRHGKETASFEYSKTWLGNPYRFSLEPALVLHEGTHHTEKALFGSIGDSAPDRWGRMLMQRFFKSQNLNEIDYLVLVNDELRQGALRFKRADDQYLSYSTLSVPLIIDLPKLIAAANTITGKAEIADELKLLLAPGSSLGGARPKAVVRDVSGNLYVAKFPRQDDDYAVVLWEAVALTLAKHAKITVPEWQLHHHALLIKRFDRCNNQRIPFLSAMSMIGAQDNESNHSYLEIVDAIMMHGARPEADMHELWRRIIFSILISNTDDHLRNHAFLYELNQGWKLSPAYDLNPSRYSSKNLSLNISETSSVASIEVALSVIDYFQLTLAKAHSIVNEVTAAVQNWHSVAKSLHITNAEIERMRSAFLC